MTHIIPSYLHLVVVVLTLCLVDCMPLNTETRVKRGFRANVADRMAHGFGKRGYSINEQDLSQDLNGWIGDTSFNTPISSVADFTKLMASNKQLARVIVVKFIDANGDDVITSDELFRPVNY